MARLTKSDFEKAMSDLPICMVGALMGDEKTIGDLVYACQVQLDLIEEGQDGTEEDDPKAIRRWLKKWSSKI
jgi:glutathione S-transferase